VTYRPSDCDCADEATADAKILELSALLSGTALQIGSSNDMCDSQALAALAIAMARVACLRVRKDEDVGDAKKRINEAARMARGFVDDFRAATRTVAGGPSAPSNDNGAERAR